MMKKMCFTDYDVDGATSYLLLTWFFKEQIPYEVCTVKSFKETFSKWLVNNNPDEYMIFILDLDVSKFKDLVDRKNVVIIDHHSTHNPEYVKAKSHVEIETSCAKLIYDKFKVKNFASLTNAQKILMLLTDDYDSYTLQLKGSKDLNTLFWNNRNTDDGVENSTFNAFIKNYKNGYHTPNLREQSVIKYYNTKLENVIKNLTIYKGEINIQNKVRSVYATFVDSCINDVGEYLIDNCKADIAILVNQKNNTISFRRNDNAEDLHIGKFAEVVAEGGGHEYAGGGIICEKFMDFTRLLKPIA